MLEHIFRNINDIRIFDTMTEFVSNDYTIDIDEIMDMLEYPEYKRIEVEDSVDHLVKQHILSTIQKKIEGKTGCKICTYLDKFKIPRFGEHKTHIPEQMNIGLVDEYYMKDNPITQALRGAVFAHVFVVEGLEEYIKDKVVPDMVSESKSKE
jgi:hypothetical protein